MNLKQKDPVQTGGIVWSSSLGNACNFEVKKKKVQTVSCLVLKFGKRFGVLKPKSPLQTVGLVWSSGLGNACEF